MTGEVAGLIAEAVDSQTKLDLVIYYVSNPFAVETLGGLSARIDCEPTRGDVAVRDLIAAGFLRAVGPRGFCPQTVFTLNPEDPRTRLWRDLVGAYAGPERSQVLALVEEADRRSGVRRAVADRRLHDLHTRFLAMVSDQLRNPVSTIMGLVVSLLTRGEDLNEEQTRSLEMIQEHTQVLIRLVEDLLLCSRLDNGTAVTLSPSPFDLVALAREVEADFAAENDGYQWSLDVPTEPLLLEADRGQLRQVYGVLVRNALKFSPPGTRITVSAGAEGDRLWGAVEDEGPGLSPADEEHIFNLFFQAETDATRLSGGLGLGLYLARVIVEAHGGEIGAEPKTGPGLRVAFRLPREVPEPTAAVLPQEPESPPG